MTAPTSTREKLLQAAVALIGEQGVQVISHRNVETRAGVARGSTRYHFQSREALLAAVLEHMATSEAALLARTAEAVEGGSLEPGVMDEDTQAQAMQAMAAMHLADPVKELARFELFLYAARRPELGDVLARWRATFVQLSAAHLRARGAPHPDAAARMMVAAMDGLILHALTAPHEDYRTWGPAWMALLASVAADLDT